MERKSSWRNLPRGLGRNRENVSGGLACLEAKTRIPSKVANERPSVDGRQE